MVYRGKPSKACERCRKRRIKCDLQPSKCGQCQRANVICSGYRDDTQVRWCDQSGIVTSKGKDSKVVNKPIFAMATPHTIHIPLSTQARDLFFIQYTSNKCWSFLNLFYTSVLSSPSTSSSKTLTPSSTVPNALVLALQAASLAHLWYEVSSLTALLEARTRYAQAIRATRELLKKEKEVKKDTAIFTVLLLDVFEKITDAETLRVVGSAEKGDDGVLVEGTTTQTHLEGALGLVKLRGLKEFTGGEDMKLLIRLYHYCAAGCVTNGLASSQILHDLKRHLDTHLGMNSGVSLSSLLMTYASLRQRYCEGRIDEVQFVMELEYLEAALHLLEISLPKVARYTTVVLEKPSTRVYGTTYHRYVNRTLCQGRNLLRVTRLDVVTSLLRYYGDNTATSSAYQSTITRLTHEILASVASYTICFSSSPSPSASTITLSTTTCIKPQLPPRCQRDCYLLLFPLFAAGKLSDDQSVRDWVLKELRYMHSHFAVRMANTVADLLKFRREEVGVWEVQRLVGCYSFSV